MKVQNESLQPFSQAAKSIVEGDLYTHYKGNEYKVLSVARHSETLEELIVYQALYGTYDVWVRPLNMFFETINLDGKETPRFKKSTL